MHAADQARIAVSPCKAVAGRARLRDFHDRFSDGPSISDGDMVLVGAADGEVLAEGAGAEVRQSLRAPARIVLDGIGQHGLLRTAVRTAVGHRIAGQPGRGEMYAAGHRSLVDGAE